MTTENTPKNRKNYMFIIGLSGLIAALDFLLGPEYAMSLFFIFPVIWAGWQKGFVTAAILAGTLCLVRFFCHWAWGFPMYVNPAAVNTVFRAISLILLAFITAQLAWKFQKLKLRIHQLESHFPVCSACSQIRTQDGDWIPLNTPIPKEDRKQCLCPQCKQKTTSPIPL